MENRPQESLKETANILAQLIARESDDLTYMTELRERLEPAQGIGQDTGSGLREEAEASLLGIWKKTMENGQEFFERDADKNIDWPLWANIHRIPVKKERKRIVLLGESVARGYFYDPYYNVAAELEGILRRLDDLQDVEVIDLARTNMRMAGLATLVNQCSVLNPDAVVLFAGNNWFPDLRETIGPKEYAEMHALFAGQSFQGLKPYLERRFTELIRNFLAKVRAALGEQGIPVIFLIPGFNLRDWRSDEIGKAIPRLKENEIRGWLDARTRAEAALQEGRQEEARRAAEEMIRIDAFNPLGHELLAEYFMQTEQWKEAHRCFEDCRDAILVNRGGNNHPRCFGIIREALLSMGREYGVEVVDLPHIYSEWIGEGVPDRRLFFDYCHLTLEGIRLSMRHAAGVLARTLTGRQLSPEKISDAGLEPDKRVQAIAHFCAAIHNGHNDQSPEIVRYYCQKALAFSREIREEMLQFIDLATRYAPTVLCQSFEGLIAGGRMKQYEGGFALRPPKGKKLLDIVLVDAITQTLEAAGIEVRASVGRLRMDEHRVTPEGVNLMESFYSSTSYQDFLINEPLPGFMQIRGMRSVFRFFTDRSRPLNFELVFRLPGRMAKGMVRVYINNRETAAAELPASSVWAVGSFTLEPVDLAAGLNRLTLEWPYTPLIQEGGEPVLTSNGFLNRLMPAIAEVHAFNVVEVSEQALPQEIVLEIF